MTRRKNARKKLQKRPRELPNTKEKEGKQTVTGTVGIHLPGSIKKICGLIIMFHIAHMVVGQMNERVY